MKKIVVIWTFTFLTFIVLACTIDISSYIPSAYTTFNKNKPFLVSAFSLIIIFIFIWLMVTLYLLNKYSFKVEKLSLGGINILFNESSKLYIKSIKNHLDSKRAIFNISEDVDAFDEVIASYYQTYKYIKDEMRLLDPKKDRELYNFSNDMLMILNRFLTNNQNNYKRWFNHVTDKDEVKDNQTKNTLIVHCTPINKIQEQYYNYNKIMTEFREVNEFFMKKVKSKFDINTEKWDSF